MLEQGAYADMPICKDCNAAKFQQKGLWRYLWREEQQERGSHASA